MSILICFILITLFVLIHKYIDAMTVALPTFKPYELAVNSNKLDFVDTSNWVDKLSNKSSNPFVYPAPVLQVKLLFEDDVQENSQEVFRVSVGAIDDYQFFCINQVFNAHKIKYSYYKAGENVWLVVLTQDENYLRSVLDKLKYYEINYVLAKT
ncbi:hypothetical protein [Helicobacter mesocricetorum]|uniref:hypothetical protein n=1 Tax=Helicobacter mesocricetorum TaxID=87012 RepID=UPI001F241678|nr:hypothetical protein [Helicobacter mesocricetorum]